RTRFIHAPACPSLTLHYWLQIGLSRQQGLQRCSDAASRVGHTCQVKAHLDTTKCSREHKVVKAAEMPNTKYFARKFRQPSPYGHVEIFQNDVSQPVCVVPVRHKSDRYRIGILAGILTNDVQSPGSNSGASRFGVPRVSAKYVWQALLVQHGERFAQAVEQVGRGSVRKETAVVMLQHLLPVP